METKLPDIDIFMDLFINRSDVFAEQQDNGSYFPIRQPITSSDVIEHLSGLASYGTYVLEPGTNSVTYVVWDLDILDDAAAEALCTLVQLMVDHPLCLVREFSGNKGTHVWLFFDRPVPAEKVRRWVSADFMPHWVEVATERGWPAALEVFPKQDTVMEGGYGNLVKLPLGVHRVSGARSELVRFEGWPTRLEDVVPFPADLVPDREPVGTTLARRDRVVGEGPTAPFPCVNAIMRDGVGRGARDRAMFHLALYCYGHGLDQDLAQEVCNRANENFTPPLTASEVHAKVTSAYRGNHASASCGADWLVDICPGPCKAGWHVHQGPSGGELAAAGAGSLVPVEVVATTSDAGRKRITVRHDDAANTPTFIIN